MLREGGPAAVHLSSLAPRGALLSCNATIIWHPPLRASPNATRFYANTDTIPAVLRWIRYISHLYW